MSMDAQIPDVTAVYKVTRENIAWLAEKVNGGVKRRAEMDDDGWCSGSPEIEMPSGVRADNNPRREHCVIAPLGSYIVEFFDTYKVFDAAEVIV